MASTFPTSLDTFTNPTATSLLTSPSHSLSHSDLNDAVEALEAKVAIGNTVLGTYTAFTPTFLTGLVLGDGTVSSSYCRVNNFVHYWGRVVLGSTSTVSNVGIYLTTPINMDATVSGTFPGTVIGQAGYRDASASVTYSGIVQTLGLAGFPERINLLIQNAAGTHLTSTQILTAQPMTWTVSDVLWWNIYYKAA